MKRSRKVVLIGAFLWFTAAAIAGGGGTTTSNLAGGNTTNAQLEAIELAERQKQEEIAKQQAHVGNCKLYASTGAVTDEQRNECDDLIETTQRTETVNVPFPTQKYDDASRASGTETITQAGIEGEQAVVYEVRTLYGVELEKTEVSRETTREPVTQLIARGTYVPPRQTTSNCQNGTYVNSAGQTVCRPSKTNSGGATAICRDGTYSYSQSRRGTCSHHGGVKTWL